MIYLIVILIFQVISKPLMQIFIRITWCLLLIHLLLQRLPQIFEDNEDKTVSSDPFEIDIDDDKLFSESYDSNEPDEDEEEESYYIDEEEDESDYAESDSDIIDTNTPLSILIPLIKNHSLLLQKNPKQRKTVPNGFMRQ